MKGSGADGKRKTAGILLLGAAVICCLSGLSTLRGGLRETYTATGRSGAFEVPAPPEGTVSINFGDEEELTALPGIGEHMARLILEERESRGLFHYPEDLLSVKGIGPAKLKKIRPLLDLAEE